MSAYGLWTTQVTFKSYVLRQNPVVILSFPKSIKAIVPVGFSNWVATRCQIPEPHHQVKFLLEFPGKSLMNHHIWPVLKDDTTMDASPFYCSLKPSSILFIQKSMLFLISVSQKRKTFQLFSFKNLSFFKSFAIFLF